MKVQNESARCPREGKTSGRRSGSCGELPPGSIQERRHGDVVGIPGSYGKVGHSLIFRDAQDTMDCIFRATRIDKMPDSYDAYRVESDLHQSIV